MTDTSDSRLFGIEDYWQSPHEFLARGKGDCEDYALLAQHLLRRQQCRAWVFSVYGPAGYAHTVCAFQEQSRYDIINLDRVFRYRAESFRELATRINPRWTWAAVARRTGHRGRPIAVFYRDGE